MGKETWVNFKALKAAITMEAALAHYNVKLRRVNQDYLRGKCPLPSHPENSTSDSFIVNTTKNVWSCKNTGCRQGTSPSQGNVLDLVRFYEQCTVREAGERMMAWNGTSAAPAQARPPASSRPEPARPEPAEAENHGLSPDNQNPEVNKPLGFTLKDVAYHPYLEGRGISKELAAQFGVGFFPGKSTWLQNHRIVIPLHNEKSELLGYAGRCIDGNSPDKYKLPAGFKKSLELYNLHRVKGEEEVVVVEGFIDCMKLYAAGYNCVALMGCSLSEEQHRKLSRFKRLILFLDGDPPGRTASAEITLKLAETTFVRNANPGNDKQPDELTSDQIQNLLG